MPQENTLPFHSFTFTLIADGRPRASLRMKAIDDVLYELHVERGSAANPSSQFTRQVPLSVAERLRDTLQRIGAFGWEDSYGDSSAPGTRKWNVNIVFKEGVFAIASKGGSDAPAGFDELLEELYRLDFPRPDSAGAQGGASAGTQDSGRGIGSALNSLGLGGMGGMGPMSAADLSAYAATGGLPGSMGGNGASGVDFSQLADALKGRLPGLDAADMQNLLAQANSNPQAIQQRMKDEFRHLSPSEQNQMLDALAATGLATREWWERFFRGN